MLPALSKALAESSRLRPSDARVGFTVGDDLECMSDALLESLEKLQARQRPTPSKGPVLNFVRVSLLSGVDRRRHATARRGRISAAARHLLPKKWR